MLMFEPVPKQPGLDNRAASANPSHSTRTATRVNVVGALQSSAGNKAVTNLLTAAQDRQPSIQRHVYIENIDTKFSGTSGNLLELKHLVLSPHYGLDVPAIEDLIEKAFGYKATFERLIEQILTRYDFQNRRFADVMSLIRQISLDWKSEFGIQSIDLTPPMWVKGDAAELYDSDSLDQVAVELFRYTRVRTAEPPRGATNSRGLLYVEVESTKLKGRKGWVNRQQLSDEFPKFDIFEVPKIDEAMPPLYHGSTMQAVTDIQYGRFRVGAIAAGRTYGPGVYATPYVSKAAHHGANAALTHAHHEFAVGTVKPARAMKRDEIMVHDMDREASELSKGNSMVEATRAQHGQHFAEVASQLMPKSQNDISYVEITAAARWVGKKVIVYKGSGGHVIYVFLDADLPRITGIAVEGVAPNSVAGWEDLPWYHEAQDRDRIQGAMNELST
jgi:hypothetical protein